MHLTLSKRLTFKTSYKLITCALLVFLADFLFYNHYAGWTVGLFGTCLLLAVVYHTPIIRHRVYFNVACCAAMGLALALMESLSELAVILFLLTMLAVVLIPRCSILRDVRHLLDAMLFYGVTCWWRLIRDCLIISYVQKRAKKHGNHYALISHWLMPTIFSLVFILLFAQANPIITNWLNAINWRLIAEYFSVGRILFWLMVATFCWAFIRPKFKQHIIRIQQNKAPVGNRTLVALVFNERAIVTALVLFNGLFLVQNLLDIVFLWSGAPLPEGMTYASYAQEGAYPLIVTALLAGGFVLVALRPGSVTESVQPIRLLVYVWVGQNIFLVISAINRLTSYIEVYSLTYLRISALIWMVMVAIGLILIVVRIYLRRSNGWLINNNALVLYVTLYTCCFINFGSIIAEYNYAHCYEVTGQGVHLDYRYLAYEVGPDALDVLRKFAVKVSGEQWRDLMGVSQGMEEQLRGQDWRQLTFRNWRMSQELANFKLRYVRF